MAERGGALARGFGGLALLGELGGALVCQAAAARCASAARSTAAAARSRPRAGRASAASEASRQRAKISRPSAIRIWSQSLR